MLAEVATPPVSGVEAPISDRPSLGLKLPDR
jgi:hypothetical protein